MGRVEMKVVTVQRDLHGLEGAFALILEEQGGPRRLKIIIAEPEARAIAMELEKYVFRRPLTHDLLVGIIHALEARVIELNIHKLEENTFFAYLVLENAAGQILEIDCRPSDGVAISLKTQATIYCDEHLLEVAGIPLEDTEEEEQSQKPAPLESSPKTQQSMPPLTPLIRSLIKIGISFTSKLRPEEVENLIEKLRPLSPEDKEELTRYLQHLLNQAIQQENYEQAAQLRDLIQRLGKS